MTDATAQLLTSLTDLATPFAQQFKLGGDKATEDQVQQERNGYNALNGSGPVAPATAAQGSNGMIDYLFGDPLQRTKKKSLSADIGTAVGAAWIGTVVFLGALALLAYWLLKKL